ncbi:hypothetical protein LCGC14_2656210 [marine sediment metagenome]|uniref:Uncharacterized protein n=1 Tax=marine sediment metagenome TaxID=412755 RepID=A0A0F8ZTF7_9ZZZZ
MNFLQAKRKLKKLAKGEYHFLSYSITEYDNSTLSQECTVYVDGYNHSPASNWVDAFEGLQEQINPPKLKPVNIEPIEEVVKVK